MLRMNKGGFLPPTLSQQKAVVLRRKLMHEPSLVKVRMLCFSMEHSFSRESLPASTLRICNTMTRYALLAFFCPALIICFVKKLLLVSKWERGLLMLAAQVWVILPTVHWVKILGKSNFLP